MACQLEFQGSADIYTSDDTLLYMVHDTFEDDVNHVVEGGDWYVEVSGILILNEEWSGELGRGGHKIILPIKTRVIVALGK